jgi:glycosyltransferase involved in cell wall biosynthesis
VVDDGSTDNTAGVVARYPGVRYIRQENRGTAAARNMGLRESTGGYLVFLDADDRLLPEALETGLSCLDVHPECAFVFGLCKVIAHDGSSLPISQKPYIEDDNYFAMLQKCHIWHPAAVMYRRSVLDSAIGFDTSLLVCSDYDLYLRVARSWPIYCHNNVVSEYRKHSANKSLNNARMLENTLSILRSQQAFIKGNTQGEEAYRIGMINWQGYYCMQSVKQVWAYAKGGGDRKQAMLNILTFLEYSPQVLLRLSKLAAGKLYKVIVGAKYVKLIGICF